MSEMVDRVARALCKADALTLAWGDNRDARVDAYVKSEWMGWLDHARAAIAAMREPTAAMTHRAFRYADAVIRRADIEDAWRHMIDAAQLADSPTTEDEA